MFFYQIGCQKDGDWCLDAIITGFLALVCSVFFVLLSIKLIRLTLQEPRQRPQAGHRRQRRHAGHAVSAFN
jgi:hypothetical protein